MSPIQNRRFFVNFRTLSRIMWILALLWIPILSAEIADKEPMKYKGIIFDFNGVLLWDSHLHEKAWQEVSQTLRGSRFSYEEILVHPSSGGNPPLKGRVFSKQCWAEYEARHQLQSQALRPGFMSTAGQTNTS